MDTLLPIVLIGLVAGGLVAVVIYASTLLNQIKTIKSENQKKIEELVKKNQQKTEISERDAIEKASQIAKAKLLEAEKRVLELETKSQEDFRKLREQFKAQERILDDRERIIIDRSKTLDSRFGSLEQKEKGIENTKAQLLQQRQQLSRKLEEIAQMSRNEATIQLKSDVEKDLGTWMSKKVREAQNEIEYKIDDQAKNMLVETMSSAATDYVSEYTTTTFTIEDEALKGKIIGKEGRNINAFQKLTGVDVIIDESPNQVTLSSFDPIRREVAALTLKKLLSDGRVHPGAIEDTVEKVKKDLLKIIKKTGEDMVYEVGLNNIPTEIIMFLGRFKYRYSYGQNLVKHTLEMVKMGEFLARELKADIYTSKLACLLHDIGKVMPEEGKQHHHISGEIARKYFPNNEKLINAIEAHHYDIDSKCVEAEIVRIADAISGARPGARRDSYEDYVKRVRALEDIALKQKGVKEAFAIHAGREVRVIIKPDETSDEDARTIAYKISKEIEATQNYPGVIKVNVIRELRVTEEAK